MAFMVRITVLILLVAFSLTIFACGKKGPPTLKDYRVGLNFPQKGAILDERINSEGGS